MTLPSWAGTALAAALLLLTLAGGPASAAPPRGEIVIDADSGKVLHAYNADTRTQPASLAKMMTLYLAFEALDRGDLRLDQPLPVSARAASMSPSKLGLKPRSTIRVQDAILALVTKSANDVAAVMAEALGGTEENFAKLMTAKARELGMASTTFRNASGLPHSSQITTARDMATLSQALLRNHARHYHYFSQTHFTYNGTPIRSHNRLMARYEGMDGLKTGFVNASGFNLAASAERNGRRLIAVVLGGTSARSRDDRVAALLDQAFGAKGKSGQAIAAAASPGKAEAKPSPIPAAKALVAQGDTSPAGSWALQVGAFKSAKAAKASLETVRGKLDALRKAASTVVRRKNQIYLARFTGLSKADADTACRALKKKKQDCLVLASN